MRKALFKVSNNVTKEDDIKKMNYFDDKAKEIREIFENNTTTGRDLARELRKEWELVIYRVLCSIIYFIHGYSRIDYT
ncbi:hypothetical protein [Staphylococcus simulans]|uniref:hypothetical protein n=1 Tax=Staphylococcus simulans TaxID=1286 RepID=UPI000D1DE506|nr:hypothetical protein [Staphylococcus simulans]PTJ45302.1 hypothetical protein BU014_11415 [Staphylococcus simulans]